MRNNNSTNQLVLNKDGKFLSGWEKNEQYGDFFDLEGITKFSKIKDNKEKNLRFSDETSEPLSIKNRKNKVIFQRKQKQDSIL